MEPEKASTRMKTKKTKMLISFKNSFCSKNWQIKHKSLGKSEEQPPQKTGYISNSNFKFKFSNSKQTFVFNLPGFAAKSIFKTYQHFCFLCFHSR